MENGRAHIAAKPKILRAWDGVCPTPSPRLAGMKNKRSQPDYGVLVLCRQSIRRLQSEWQPVEPPPPPMRLTPESNQVLFFSATRDSNERDAA